MVLLLLLLLLPPYFSSLPSPWLLKDMTTVIPWLTSDAANEFFG